MAEQLKVEHITYNAETNDFDVNREAIVSKYGIGTGFAAGNVILYELGHITLEELKARSCFVRFDGGNYVPSYFEWSEVIRPYAKTMGWDDTPPFLKESKSA